MTLRRGEAEVPFGYFGGDYRTAFAGVPEALEAAATFRRMRIAGFSLTVIGTTAMIADLVLILAGVEAAVDDTKTGADGLRPLTFALLGGGLALSIAGIMLETTATGYAADAVNRYNAHVLRRSRRLGLSVHARF